MMPEIPPESLKHGDKKDKSSNAIVNTSAPITGTRYLSAIATSLPNTSTLSTEFRNVADSNAPHYDATEYQVQFSRYSQVLQSSAAVHHVARLSSSYPPHDLTKTEQSVGVRFSYYESQNGMKTMEQPHDSAKKYHHGVEPQRADGSIASLDTKSFYYSHVEQEALNLDKSDCAALGRINMIEKKYEVATNCTAAGTTLESDTVQAYAGSYTQSDLESAPPPIITEHMLPKYQLEAWIKQTSDGDMTWTEKLEKNNHFEVLW